MNLSKKIILASSLVFLTACSTSKAEVEKNLVNEEIKGQNTVGNFQEEEIIDFNDPDFNIENIEYDSCCK